MLRRLTGANARLVISLFLVIATALAVIVPVRANHTGAHAFALDCDLAGCHAAGQTPPSSTARVPRASSTTRSDRG